MMHFRSAKTRGYTRLDWLESWHGFSFGDYFDSQHMGFSVLRVFNDDIIAPRGAFGMHGHRDMEIITYVLEGALEHRDSLGNGSVIRPGEVQYMSAGTGIRHSESNPSESEKVHLLQIWILPELEGVKPRYDQKQFPAAERDNRFRLVASGDGRDGSIEINQKADMYAGNFGKGQKPVFDLSAARNGWLHVARGALDIEGQMLRTGDAAGFTDTRQLRINVVEDAEILLFDLP